jgi:hypothetical protein
MIKKITLSILFFIAISTYSQQEKINNYKYIIVKDKFKFLKNIDQYQTSSLTKFLLEKKGFTVFLSSDKSMPKDLLVNRCLALTGNVIDNSSMFTVKSKIELKDCYGNVLYVSKEGKSKHKDYKKSYHESIRNAYNSMIDLNYKFMPNKDINKSNGIVKTQIGVPVNNNIVIKNTNKVKEMAPVKKVFSNELVKSNNNLETLYAQSKTNGFQLVNTAPAIIFTVLKTKVKDVFVIKGKDGILYKRNNYWVAEYYENNNLVVKQYTIKF